MLYLIYFNVGKIGSVADAEHRARSGIRQGRLNDTPRPFWNHSPQPFREGFQLLVTPKLQILSPSNPAMHVLTTSAHQVNFPAASKSEWNSRTAGGNEDYCQIAQRILTLSFAYSVANF